MPCSAFHAMAMPCMLGQGAERSAVLTRGSLQWHAPCLFRPGREGQATHLALHATSLILGLCCVEGSGSGGEDPVVKLAGTFQVAVVTAGHLCQADTVAGAPLRAGLPQLLASPGAGLAPLLVPPEVSRATGAAGMRSLSMALLSQVGNSAWHCPEVIRLACRLER